MALTRPVNDFKDSVRVSTTGSNITLTGGAPNTLDGVTLALNDSILVKDQTNPAQNGIYRITTLGTGSNGTWTRRSDFNDYRQISPGSLLFSEVGTLNGNTFYYIRGGIGNVTVDSTGLSFANLSATFGNGGTGYGNTQVGQYLTTYTGAITAANLVTNGTSGNISGANYIIANVFTANLTANITGNLTAGNITASGAGGQLIGYLTGAIGANVANTGSFTSVTTSGNLTAGNAYITSNIGIGTTTPSYPLVISKSSTVTYLYQYDGTGAQVTGVNGSGLGVSGTFSNTDMAFFSNSVERMRINAYGNVGIGTASPISSLTLGNNKTLAWPNSSSSYNGTTTGSQILKYSDNSLYIDNLDANTSMIFRRSGPTETMRLDANGNVGIGTASPIAKLQVNGTFAATGVPTQMVTVRADGKTTYSVATAGSAGTYISDLNATITPRSASSSVFITYCISFECINDCVFLLYRSVGGSDTLIGRNVNDTNYWSGTWIPGYDADNSSTPRTNQMSYLDSPATTSAVTYKLMIQSAGSGAFTFYQNRAIGSAGQQNYEVGISQVFLQEISV